MKKETHQNKVDSELAEAHYIQGMIYKLKLDFVNALYHLELSTLLQPNNKDYNLAFNKLNKENQNEQIISNKLFKR